jgi:hypothetical protein
MALPTPDNLKTMDYAFQGQPFVDVPAKDSIDLKTMDYSFQGQPFVRNYTSVSATVVQDLIGGFGIIPFAR